MTDLNSADNLRLTFELPSDLSESFQEFLKEQRITTIHCFQKSQSNANKLVTVLVLSGLLLEGANNAIQIMDTIKDWFSKKEVEMKQEIQVKMFVSDEYGISSSNEVVNFTHKESKEILLGIKSKQNN